MSTAPASQIVIKFEGPGSAEFDVEKIGDVTPPQMLAVAEVLRLMATHDFEKFFARQDAARGQTQAQVDFIRGQNGGRVN